MRFVQAGCYKSPQYRAPTLGVDPAAPMSWSKWIGVGVLATGGFMVLRYIYRHTIGDG
jgi:hypothetical protein